MIFYTRDIAQAFDLTEAAIRQWLCRAPAFAIGTLDGHVRTFNQTEALTIAIAAEMLRHGLGRPHECLPVAKGLAASPVASTWVHRPRGGDITVTANRPDATSINIPVELLRKRLAGSNIRNTNG